MSNCCIGPALYEIQLAALRATRDRLERQLAGLLTQVSQLETIIGLARQLAHRLAEQATNVLQAKTGIPRGVWSYNQGQYDLATEALKGLETGEPPTLTYQSFEDRTGMTRKELDYYSRWY